MSRFRQPRIDTRVDQHKRGRDILKKWTLSLFCKVVDRETRKVKKAFTMKTSEIAPEFVEAWSLSGLQGVVEEESLVLCELLYTGVQTRRARKKGGGTQWSYVYSLATSFLADAVQVISVIVSQMAHHRSHYATRLY
jgi:hypothetical protein